MVLTNSERTVPSRKLVVEVVLVLPHFIEKCLYICLHSVCVVDCTVMDTMIVYIQCLIFSRKYQAGSELRFGCDLVELTPTKKTIYTFKDVTLLWDIVIISD